MTELDTAERTGHQYPMRFTGDGFEYFKIAAVNLALTLLTLGLYSPWAKVRTRQYFHGHTLLDNAAFQYTAKPITILKGRLIALALLAVYVGVQRFAPLALAPVVLVLALLAPWLIMRSLAFNLVNTVHRGLRFHFEDNLAGAYRTYAPPAMLIAVMVSAGSMLTPDMADNIKTILVLYVCTIVVYLVLFPWFMKRIVQFNIDHTRYGDAAFLFSAGSGKFYKYYLGNGLLFLGIALCWVLGTAGLAAVSAGADALALPDTGPVLGTVLAVAAIAISLVATSLAMAWVKARNLNLKLNHISAIGHLQLASAVRVPDLAAIYFKNALLLILTLGIAYPWNRVRTTRYLTSCVTVQANSSLDDFAASATKHYSAAGEEISEVLDLGIGF